jgi:hypothetical protein
MGRYSLEIFSGATQTLRAGSKCARQNADAGTNRGSGSVSRIPFDSLQILAVRNERGNVSDRLVEAHGAVVPTDLERSKMKIKLFNFGIHSVNVRRARDRHGRLRLARSIDFAGVCPPAKQ